MAFVFYPLKVNLIFTQQYCTGDPDAHFCLCALGNLQCDLAELSLLPVLCLHSMKGFFLIQTL